MFAGGVNNKFSTVLANLYMTRIINGYKRTNSNKTYLVIGQQDMTHVTRLLIW